MGVIKNIIGQLKDALGDVTQGYNTTSKGTPPTVVSEKPASTFVQNLFSQGAKNLEMFGNPLGKMGEAVIGYVREGVAQQTRLKQGQTTYMNQSSSTYQNLASYAPLAIGGIVIYNLIKK